MAGAAGGDRSIPRVHAIHYAAVLVVVSCSIVTACAAVEASHGLSAELIALFAPGAVYLAIAFVFTRNLLLAIFTGIAPVAGVVWDAALGQVFRVPAVDASLSMALAAIVSLFYADEFEAQ